MNKDVICDFMRLRLFLNLKKKLLETSTKNFVVYFQKHIHSWLSIIPNKINCVVFISNLGDEVVYFYFHRTRVYFFGWIYIGVGEVVDDKKKSIN